MFRKCAHFCSGIQIYAHTRCIFETERFEITLMTFLRFKTAQLLQFSLSFQILTDWKTANIYFVTPEVTNKKWEQLKDAWLQALSLLANTLLDWVRQSTEDLFFEEMSRMQKMRPFRFFLQSWFILLCQLIRQLIRCCWQIERDLPSFP